MSRPTTDDPTKYEHALREYQLATRNFALGTGVKKIDDFTLLLSWAIAQQRPGFQEGDVLGVARLAAIQGAKLANAGKVIAVDMLESKLATAKEFGATHIVDASSGDPVAAIREMTGGAGVDYAFEAIGNKKAAEQCFDAINRGGTATIIGMIPVGQKIELPGAAFLGAKKIQGSLMGSNRFRIDMPRYIEFYMRGLLKLDEMITRTGKLEDVNDAFRAMKAGEVARTVLTF